MSESATQKLWFLAAVIFMILGIAQKQLVYLILGFCYICIALTKKKKNS